MDVNGPVRIIFSFRRFTAEIFLAGLGFQFRIVLGEIPQWYYEFSLETCVWPHRCVLVRLAIPVVVG
jgi:hypothetical protein